MSFVFVFCFVVVVDCDECCQCVFALIFFKLVFIENYVFNIPLACSRSVLYRLEK